MKTVLIIHHMSVNNLDTPPKGKIKKLGHRLCNLLNNLQSLPLSNDNPLKEIDPSSISFDILSVLDNFATSTRYFNLDTLANVENISDPLDDYTNVIRRILIEEVPQKVVTRAVQQGLDFANELSGVAIAIDPKTPDWTSAEILEQMILLPSLQELTSKHAVYHVIKIIKALRKLLETVCDTAQTIEKNKGLQQSIPDMYEFLSFTWVEKSDALRKKRWP